MQACKDLNLGGCNVLLQTFAVEILSFQTTQEYLVSKYDHFKAASLPLLKTFAPATYSKEFG